MFFILILKVLERYSGGDMRIIDLTHLLEEDMPVFPGTEKPILLPALTMEKDGFREKLLTMFSHTGTHMDAPSHMIPDGKNLDDFEVHHFVGEGIVINCLEVERDITLDHLKKYDLSDADFVLLRTGWDEKWGTESYFTGFPALTEQAADYLASLHLKGLGVDCISVDLMENDKFTVHKILLKENMVMIENLCNLNKLDGVFTLQALPLKIKEADGSPIRAIAIK